MDKATSEDLAFLESPTRVPDIVGREDCVNTVNSNGQSTKTEGHLKVDSSASKENRQKNNSEESSRPQ
jgi:hypothetical protein